MTVNKPMEHWDRTKICSGCVNKNCKNGIFGNDFMTYSRDCERYDCSERMVEVENNEEHIRKLPTWELAEFIFNVSNNSTKITKCSEKCDDCEYSDSYCIFQIAEWLKEQKE